MTQINNISDLKEFISTCNNLKSIQDILKHSLNVSLIIYSDDSINDVKKAVNAFLDRYIHLDDVPLFITTMGLKFEHLK